MASFAERLRELRIKKEIGQKEVGAIIGVSDSSIRKYEAGERTPDPKAIIKLADFFGVTTDDLLGRNKNTQVNKEISPEELTKLFESLPPEEQKAFLIRHIIPVLGDEPKK
ncbi:helix-turn-helix domain-containing protein [Sporomusa sp.]|uniref:helix-turn-helix domain-containing protein n=1 Tax=Sporomusa sp. TaxID=2078658 RepID=UPI002C95D880|nr:helix-turn-helix domain-containing protein [Sporomusa sp.]HWR06179.1 helix-turn-helix domain-containing protein [Sporomusa sp.]